jgi:filamentous hemagglutinin family protein
MPLPTPAQISTDGTLGPSINLAGPNFQIGAHLGRQHGTNLFHSFRDFNLNSHESVTFSGPNTVQNLLSRVTGGNPSHIDGTIRSTIPNANLYFLNPYGIMFGPNARLDVQGSFHASTADYLRLGEDGRFDARQPSNSLLTVAPVEAFGFLSPVQGNIASISVEGYNEVTEDWEPKTTGLTVPEGKSLSLIGGNLQIKNGTFFNTITVNDEGHQISQTHKLPILSAPEGRMNLASVAASGEIQLGTIDVSSFARLASIQISENVQLQVTGEGGGAIFIRSGEFVVHNSTIEANTLGDKKSGLIDIQANRVSLSHGAEIKGNTEGSADGADINIQAETITIAGENQNFVRSAIYARSGISKTLVGDDLGKAGTISLQAKKIALTDGALISGSSYGGGQGGNVIINATESVSLSGEAQDNNTVIAAAAYGKGKPGHAGKVFIQAKKIRLTDGSYIVSSTTGTGEGGEVKLRASEFVSLSGEDSQGNLTRIRLTTSYKKPEAGNAGSLDIEAANIFLTHGAYLTSRTTGNGDGGQITLLAKEAVILTGLGSKGNGSDIFALTRGEGNGGTISINTNVLLLADKASFSADSFGEITNAGMAGDITIQANRLLLTDSRIGTATTAASGGNISLTIPTLLHLRNSQITTSVKSGVENGGNMTITTPVFIVLDKSRLVAQADEGRGGNIRIAAEQFIKSPDSLVSASSRLGLDGNVQIDSPAVDMDRFLVMLPGGYIDASGQLPPPCTAARLAKNRFVVKRLAGSPPSPDDFQSNRLVLLPDKEWATQKNSARLTGSAGTGQSAPKGAFKMMGCRPALSEAKSQAMHESRVIDEQLF